MSGGKSLRGAEAADTVAALERQAQPADGQALRKLPPRPPAPPQVALSAGGLPPLDGAAQGVAPPVADTGAATGLLVVHVSVTADAWRRGAFQTLLAQRNIVLNGGAAFEVGAEKTNSRQSASASRRKAETAADAKDGGARVAQEQTARARPHRVNPSRANAVWRKPVRTVPSGKPPRIILTSGPAIRRPCSWRPRPTNSKASCKTCGAAPLKAGRSCRWPSRRRPARRCRRIGPSTATARGSPDRRLRMAEASRSRLVLRRRRSRSGQAASHSPPNHRMSRPRRTNRPPSQGLRNNPRPKARRLAIWPPRSPRARDLKISNNAARFPRWRQLRGRQVMFPAKPARSICNLCSSAAAAADSAAGGGRPPRPRRSTPRPSPASKAARQRKTKKANPRPRRRQHKPSSYFTSCPPRSEVRMLFPRPEIPRCGVSRSLATVTPAPVDPAIPAAGRTARRHRARLRQVAPGAHGA